MDVVFVTRLNGGADDCRYLQAICPQVGDNDQVPFFSINLPFVDKSASYVEVSNCGGVFCFNSFNGRIVLCNPLTNSLKFLPPTQPSPPSSYSSYICYGNCGFGYDSRSDDFKVIRLFDVFHYEENDIGRGNYRGCITKSELFSFKRNSWNEIQTGDLGVMLCPTSGSALVEGSYHWLVGVDGTFCILAFDFSEEIFSFIPLPPSYNDSTSLCHVVKTQNNLLGVIFSSRRGESKSFEVWECGKDKDWSKLYDDAILTNVKKPLKLNGSLMYAIREIAGGLHQLLVYDWVGRILRELDIYDCEDAMAIVSIAPTPIPGLH